jgi:hypothetical protein
MALNSNAFDPPNDGDQLAEPDFSRPYDLGTLLKTFLAVALAAAAYEEAKRLLFPHITLWQSHAITVVLV